MTKNKNKKNSSDIWVSGSECPETVCPVARFTEASSSTYKTDNSVFNITYGVGQAVGIYATDTITIAGATITDQQFGIATSTSEIYHNISSSDALNTTGTLLEGVFGLAYPSITSAEKAYNPFFFSLMNQKLISNPVFSIFLNGSEDLGDSGQIIFGGEDNTKHTGDVQYLPVTDTQFSSSGSRASETYGFWSVYSQGFGVLNGVKGDVNLETNKPFRLLVDTGTTLTRIPNDVLSAFILSSVGSNNVAYDQINGYYQIRCSMADTDIMFQVQLTDALTMSDNPTILNIPLRDIIVPMDTYHISTASVCMLGLAPTESTIILGDSVLRSFYLVFDAGQNRIGFAPAVGSNATITGKATSDASSSSPSSSSNSSKTQSSSSASHLQPCALLSLMFFTALFLY